MEFKYTVEPGSSRQAWKVLENGELIAVCQNETNAVTVTDLLNQHDTLKKKEALLDETVPWIELYKGVMLKYGDGTLPNTKKGLITIEALLAKIKELK